MLVPWREGEPYRDHNWKTARPYLEALGYPLFTGDSPGPWARAAACNTASSRAGEWDVAIIADADTVLMAEPVRAAIDRVTRTKGAARPHDRRWMLSLFATKTFQRYGPQGLKPKRDLTAWAPGGGALVMHRDAWEAVGGYDERFVGWGYEDSAMNISLAIMRTWEIVPGNAYHLWHPLPNTQSPTAKANRSLLDEHRAAHKREIAARSRAAGFDLNTVL